MASLVSQRNMDIAYPYVPKGRKIKYVPEDNEFIEAAKEFAAAFSSERQHPTGSVIVKRGIIVGRGANQAALTNPHFIEMHRQYLCVRKWLNIPSGQKYWLCPGCASPSEHSERRAIRDAHKAGKETAGADLYLWGHWWCCEPCWNAIIEAGIRDVYLLESSDILFDKNNPANIIGRQFEKSRR